MLGLALSLGHLSCGRLRDANERAGVLGKVSGNLSIDPSVVLPPVPVKIAVLWLGSDGTAVGMSEEQLSISSSALPARYELPLYHPPPANSLQSDASGNRATGVVVAYSDFNEDGELTPFAAGTLPQDRILAKSTPTRSSQLFTLNGGAGELFYLESGGTPADGKVSAMLLSAGGTAAGLTRLDLNLHSPDAWDDELICTQQLDQDLGGDGRCRCLKTATFTFAALLARGGAGGEDTASVTVTPCGRRLSSVSVTVGDVDLVADPLDPASFSSPTNFALREDAGIRVRGPSFSDYALPIPWFALRVGQPREGQVVHAGAPLTVAWSISPGAEVSTLEVSGQARDGGTVFQTFTPTGNPANITLPNDLTGAAMLSLDASQLVFDPKGAELDLASSVTVNLEVQP